MAKFQDREVARADFAFRLAEAEAALVNLGRAVRRQQDQIAGPIATAFVLDQT